MRHPIHAQDGMCSALAGPVGKAPSLPTWQVLQEQMAVQAARGSDWSCGAVDPNVDPNLGYIGQACWRSMHGGRFETRSKPRSRQRPRRKPKPIWRTEEGLSALAGPAPSFSLGRSAPKNPGRRRGRTESGIGRHELGVMGGTPSAISLGSTPTRMPIHRSVHAGCPHDQHETAPMDH
jgi:hypothetical protein